MVMAIYIAPLQGRLIRDAPEQTWGNDDQTNDLQGTRMILQTQNHTHHSRRAQLRTSYSSGASPNSGWSMVTKEKLCTRNSSGLWDCSSRHSIAFLTVHHRSTHCISLTIHVYPPTKILLARLSLGSVLDFKSSMTVCMHLTWIPFSSLPGTSCEPREHPAT